MTDHYQRITALIRKDYVRESYQLPYGWEAAGYEPVRVPEEYGDAAGHLSADFDAYSDETKTPGEGIPWARTFRKS